MQTERHAVIVEGYEIPEGFESMTCIYNCGFILIWSLKDGARDVGSVMDTHIAEHHADREFPLFFRFRKKKGE